LANLRPIVVPIIFPSSLSEAYTLAQTAPVAPPQASGQDAEIAVVYQEPCATIFP
jgi:hypothetical protein